MAAPALIAMIAAAVSGAPQLAEAQAMPLRELAGRAILMRFAGNPPAPYVTRVLRAHEAAGVILFRDNATSPDGTRQLIRRLQRAAGGDAIVALDQEGGAIRILPWLPPDRDQVDVTNAAATARATARGLRRTGVTVNLAPVADRPTHVMARRGFAHPVRQVRQAVRAYAGTGVAPTLKHFPGLGAADGNTDQVRVTVRRYDLRPFRAGIEAGAPAVMLSHAVYTSLDRRHVASQSRRIVTGILKHTLGFTGVAMTDSLEAYSVRSRMTMEQAAVRSIRAGIDLIVTTGQGTHIRAQRALIAAARRSRTFRARLTDAVARVLALQDDG